MVTDIITDAVYNLSTIHADIASVFEYYFLSPKPVTVIAVSKTQVTQAIIPLLDTGHKVFGENKVIEAHDKWLPLKDKYLGIELHLIGNLQTNKVKKALEVFDVIQTIDRPSLIDEIMKYPDMVVNKQFFIQVNTGNEPQKSGVIISELADLLSYAQLKQLPVTGLMCIPPQNDTVSHHFAIMQSLCRQYGNLKLSAGMSSDYRQAIIHGSDYIRIGTAIFGERNVL